MISKRVEKKCADNFSRLALYIAGEGLEEGEKLDHFWIENCVSGKDLDDLTAANFEIALTQKANIRTKKDKTYHLVISFGEEKPSKEAQEDIAREMTRALGFEGHHYVVGTHHNTNHYHMHMAYNKIHPQSLKVHDPAWDYYKRDKVCREMEKKWGLSVDNGIGSKGRAHPSSKAKDFEAMRWEKSFDSHVRDKSDELHALLESSRKWEELHEGLQKQGLMIVPKGKGLAIASEDGQVGMKASALSEDFGKPKLEERLGDYRAPEAFQNERLKTRVAFSDSVREKKETLLKARNEAASWQELHQAFKGNHLKLVKRGNGLAITSRNGRGHMKASALHRSFSKAALEKDLGAFIPEARQKRPANYTRKPITRHKHQKPLWEKFIQKPRRKEHIAVKALRTWRQFLMVEALGDPLAMAIIHHHNQIIQMFNFKSTARPQQYRPGQTKRDEKPEQRIYLDVPKEERARIAEFGGKWDKERKLWYVPADQLEEAQKVGGWKVLDEENLKAKQTQERIYLQVPFKERARLADFGGKWDKERKLWHIPANQLEEARKVGDWTPLDEKALKAKQTQERIYLQVPFKERERIADFGGKWDKERKLWHVPADQLEAAQKAGGWMLAEQSPEQTRTQKKQAKDLKEQGMSL